MLSIFLAHRRHDFSFIVDSLTPPSLLPFPPQPFSIRDEEYYRQLAAEFGEVVDLQLRCHHDGRLKGDAIVTFSSEEQASAAIAALDRSVHAGRTIFARFDAYDDKGSRQVYPPRQPTGTTATIFCGNLSYGATDEHVADHFRSFGTVTHVMVMRSPNGMSKGCALVTMSSPEEASTVIMNANNTVILDRPVFLREDAGPSRGGAPRHHGGGMHGGGMHGGGMY